MLENFSEDVKPESRPPTVALVEALSPYPARRMLCIMLAVALLFSGLMWSHDLKPIHDLKPVDALVNCSDIPGWHEHDSHSCHRENPPCPGGLDHHCRRSPTTTPTPNPTPTPTPNPTPCSGMFLHEHDGSCHGTLRTCNGVKDGLHHEPCPTPNPTQDPGKCQIGWHKHAPHSPGNRCHKNTSTHKHGCDGNTADGVDDHGSHRHPPYGQPQNPSTTICHLENDLHDAEVGQIPVTQEQCDDPTFRPPFWHNEGQSNAHYHDEFGPYDKDGDGIRETCAHTDEPLCPASTPGYNPPPKWFQGHHCPLGGGNPDPTPVPTSTSNPVRSVPSSPTGLTVSCVGTTGTVSWNAVSGASSYRAVEFGAGPASRTISHPTTSFTYTGKTGVTDRWRVRAQNSNGNSAWSSYRSATCSAALSPPSTPSFTSTTCVNTGGSRPLLSVEWGAVAQASSYRLERDTGTVLHNGSGLSWSRNNPAWGSVHTVKIRAENSAGNSAWSSWVTVTCPSSSSQVLTVPSVPANVAASCVGTTVTVLWDSVSGAASYFAQEFGSGPADRTIVHPTTQFTDTRTAGFSYSWRVRAQNSLGNSAWSGYETVRCPAQQVVPTGVTAVCANNVVTVSWTAVSGAAIYRVREENGNAQFDWGSGRVDPLPTSTTFTRTAGETTKWQVRAHHGGQWRPWSTYASTTCSANNTVTISWNAVSGTTSYRANELGSGPADESASSPACDFAC